MLRLLRPCLAVNSLFDITPDILAAQNIQGIIIDLDNTLIAWDSDTIQPDVIDWLAILKQSRLQLCLLSNNMSQRVNNVAEQLDIPWVSPAFKPAKNGFRTAISTLGLDPRRIAVVGDQLFTDILGGNRLGLYTIWVNPLSSQEFIGTKITRKVEKLVLYLLKYKGFTINRVIK